MPKTFKWMGLSKMMFDPPDFPYKELTDSLREHYGDDELIFNTSDPTDLSKDYVTTTQEMSCNVENQLTFHSNDAGRYFNIENSSNLFSNSHGPNGSVYIVQSENLFNYEPTLLDDTTVNQFLLPARNTSETSDEVPPEPDLLALHSCVICHEIFTSDADLLDHTISYHASNNIEQETANELVLNNSTEMDESTVSTMVPEAKDSDLDFEADWLVCSICERVLSTALEVEPTEQLCCIDSNGKSNVYSRKLHTMYVCEFCSGLFGDSDALDKHRMNCLNAEDQNYYLEDSSICNPNTTTQPVNYDCVCGKRCSSPEDLKTHSAGCQRPVSSARNIRRTFSNTNSNKMWNCGSCNQLFATARELYRHKRGEDRSPGSPLMTYVCEECDKVLGSMCALHTHKKMHKVSKPGYPCRICSRRFNQSGHLAIHMRMHTGERPYPCDLCPKAFKVKVERDDHRRTHTGERPFACSACPKTFTAAARLREHARIHTDQRWWVWSKTTTTTEAELWRLHAFSFPDGEQAQRHLQEPRQRRPEQPWQHQHWHASTKGNEPYRCDICGAAFRRPYARTVHTLIHTGEKPHECDICGTAFRRSGDMWKHKRTLHGMPPGTESECKKT